MKIRKINNLFVTLAFLFLVVLCSVMYIQIALFSALPQSMVVSRALQGESMENIQGASPGTAYQGNGFTYRVVEENLLDSPAGTQGDAEWDADASDLDFLYGFPVEVARIESQD